MIKEDSDQIDKARYFKEGLLWYNKFLKKNINLQINNIMNIYSKTITNSPLYQNKALISISESFDSEDALKPLRYLSVFIPDTEAGQRIYYSVNQRIKRLVNTNCYHNYHYNHNFSFAKTPRTSKTYFIS